MYELIVVGLIAGMTAFLTVTLWAGGPR